MADQLSLFAAALPAPSVGSLHWIPGAHRGRATLVRLFRWVPSFVFRDRHDRPVTVEHGWWYCEDLTPARDARGVTRIQGVRPESFGASIEAELAPLRAEVSDDPRLSTRIRAARLRKLEVSRG